MKQSSGKQPTVENGHLKKPAVIAAFKGCASVTKACEIADICRDTFYRWLKEDPEFREAFEKSREEAAQLLEDEAARRAYEGVERPVYQGGKQVGVVREYSDTLLIFLLKEPGHRNTGTTFAKRLLGLMAPRCLQPQSTSWLFQHLPHRPSLKPWAR